MDEFGDPECQVDALSSVQARVANGFVAAAQVGINQFVAAAKALGDVFAGQLDVDAAGPGAFGAVGTNKAADFADDVIEVAGFPTARSGKGVAMHRIACPDDGVTGIRDGMK